MTRFARTALAGATLALSALSSLSAQAVTLVGLTTRVPEFPSSEFRVPEFDS